MIDLAFIREKQLKLSREEMAGRLNLSVGRLSDWEADPAKIPLPFLYQLCSEFQITPDEIIRLEPSRPKPLQIQDPYIKLVACLHEIHSRLELLPEAPVKVREVFKGARRLVQKPKIAFLGPSDAGKSRLINSLTGLEALLSQWTPMTSATIHLKHAKDRPAWMGDRQVLICRGEGPDKAWDMDRYQDESYFRQYGIAMGELNVLKEYTNRDQGIIREEVDTAIVFLDAAILKACDLIDLPGFGTEAEHDTKHALRIFQKMDALVFVCQSNSFFNKDTDIDFLATAVEQLIMQRGLPDLAHLFIVASQAQIIGEHDLSKVLNRGYTALAQRWPEQTEGLDRLRERFFSYSLEHAGMRENFNDQLTLFLTSQYPMYIEKQVDAYINHCFNELSPPRAIMKGYILPLLEKGGFDMGVQQKDLIQLEDFKATIDSKLDNAPRIMWDATLDRYTKSLRKMNMVLQHEAIQDQVASSIFKNINHFIDRCQHPEFHIAFVGAIKAGKSTLINALLGRQLASTSVTPETAALTKFRSSKGKNYVKLTFYTSYEWEQLWSSVQKSKADVFMEEYEKLNADQEKANWLDRDVLKMEFDQDNELKQEVEKWTSSKRATHYFVKEVEVGLRDFQLPEEVVFVDTPGLDDPVKYRSDITRTYIDRANAVLVCVKSDALTGGELATIYSVFANARYNPEKVYVIGTQLDTLNWPDKDWKEQRMEWLKHLKRKDCYGSVSVAEKNLVVTAAYLYSLASDFNTLDEDTIDFVLEPVARKFRIKEEIESNLDRLIEISQINQLKRKLEDEIITKHKKLLLDDLFQAYAIQKEEIVKLLQMIKQNQEEILSAADAGIEEIRAKREASLKQLQETEEEKANLDKLIKQIKVATTKRAEDLYQTIRNMGGK